MVHEVAFRFIVQGSDNEHEAIEMACDYFCGGDFAGQVKQLEPECHEMRSGMTDELEA